MRTMDEERDDKQTRAAKRRKVLKDAAGVAAYRRGPPVETKKVGTRPGAAGRRRAELGEGQCSPGLAMHAAELNRPCFARVLPRGLAHMQTKPVLEAGGREGWHSAHAAPGDSGLCASPSRLVPALQIEDKKLKGKLRYQEK